MGYNATADAIANLTSSFRMEETSGTTWVDSANSADNGTYTAGSQTLNQSGLPGDAATKSILFGATITTPPTTNTAPLPASPGSFSLVCWFNPTNGTGGNGSSQQALLAAALGWMGIDSAGFAAFALGGGFTHGSGTTPAITSGTWTMLTAVYDHPNLKWIFYCQDTAVPTQQADSGTQPTNTAMTASSTSFPLQGNHTQYRIYQHLLTPTEVATLYNAGATGGGGATSAVITEQNLPSNHNGNITVHAVGTGTSWANGTTGFTPSGVTGWSVSSTTVIDTTHATLVLVPPGSATPPAGATGTLTLTETGTSGATTPTTTVGTPTLAIGPTSGSTGTTPTLTLTGTNTLWASETAAGLFTETGGTGAGIGTPTVTTNTAATDVLTVGSATGTLTVKDASTGATATFTANTSVPIAITDASILLCGAWVSGFTAGRAAWMPVGPDSGIEFDPTATDCTLGVYLQSAATAKVIVGGGSEASVTLPGTGSWGTANIFTSLSLVPNSVVLRFLSGIGSIAVDAASAFVLSNNSGAGGPPTVAALIAGPSYPVCQPKFRRHSSVEGAWVQSNVINQGGYNTPTLYGFTWVGSVLRWRGHGTAIRFWGNRNGEVYSLLVDGVVTGSAITEPVNDGRQDWITLAASTPDTSDHEYGLQLDTAATTSVYAIQMVGGALDTSATFPERGNLVGFGDSKIVSQGTFRASLGYLSQVARAKGRNLLNLGFSGATVSGSADAGRPGQIQDLVAAYLAFLGNGHDPTQDEIVIEAGFNDADVIGDLTAFTAAYTTVLSRLADAGATVRVLGFLDTAASPASTNRTAWNSALSTLVSGLANPLITYHDTTGWITPASDTVDGIHLNATGEDKVATQLDSIVSTWTAPAPAGGGLSRILTGM